MIRSASFAVLALALPAISSAALVLQTTGTARVINFNQVIDDTAIGGSKVYGYNTTTSYGVLSEGTTSDTGTTGLRSPSFSARGSGINLGYGDGNWTAFGTNANNDADTYDNITVSGMTIARGPGSLLGGATNVAPLGTDNTGLILGQSNAAPWRDNGFTLAVQNGTGAALSQVRLQLDTWYSDPDTNLSNLQISYSTDNTSYTALTSLVGVRTTTATYNIGDAAHWTPLQAIDQTVTLPANLANGGLVYFRVESIRPSGGSGGSWLVDNLAVTAVPVPEPAALAIFALAGLGILARKK